MITEVVLEQVEEEDVRTPVLFKGFLDPEAQAAQALLVLGKIARTRLSQGLAGQQRVRVH
ncbi:MAG TPA: hypothetical protein VFG15_21880 [Amycolatopsis sp.]|nr:hypothetical protein [Amycolatopsis sp.]